MKILFYSTGLAAEYGGSAVSESSLAQSLSEQHHLDILVPLGRLNPEFAQEKDLNRVIEITLLDTLEALSSESHWLTRAVQECDVAHLNGHWSLIQCMLAKLCKKNDKPYVLHPRGMFFVGHRKAFLKTIFNLCFGETLARDCSAVIALSQFEVRHFAPYRILEKKIQVIPNGIPISLINPNATPVSRPYFLYLGRIEQRKNLLYLVRAFAEFLKTNPNFDLRLRGPVEKKYDQEVRAEIEKLRLQENIFLMPALYHAEKWEEIQLSQAVIYPTIEEAFGRVPFEAIATRTYCLIPEQSGSAEYLKPFLPDCVFDLDKPQTLVQSLRRISQAPKNSPALEKAFRWVEKELDWKQITAQVVQIYSKITTRDFQKAA